MDPATTEIYTLSLHDALPISIATASAIERRTRTRRFGRPTRFPSSTRRRDRKSTRLNSSHVSISYAVFCLKKKIFLAYPYHALFSTTERTALHYLSSIFTILT